MALTMARLTCMNCGQPFTAAVEQVLDVELDPSAKSRLLMGQLNTAVCPHCGAAGTLNLPFIYHDPSKELALVYMPMEAGRTDMERQKLIGSLTRMVMNQMPPEQRRAHLLNPQVFLSYDNLVNRVLEADGITAEMIEAQNAKVDLLRKLWETSDVEERKALIRDNEEMLDQEFFDLLYVNQAQAAAAGRQDLVDGMTTLRQMLLESTPVGRRIAKQDEVLKAFQEEQTREKLIALLVDSDDESTRVALMAVGQPLMDYRFFQLLTQRIEATEDKKERQRLEALRQEVLDVRDGIQAQIHDALDKRVDLLRDLLLSEKPELLLRRHLGEIDELFFSVLQAQIEQAEKAQDAETSSRLQEIVQMLQNVAQEQAPPELRLLMQVLEAEDLDKAREALEAGKELVNLSFVRMLEQVEQDMKQEGGAAAERAAAILDMARSMVGAGQPPQPETPPPGGGLEIARR